MTRGRPKSGVLLALLTTLTGCAADLARSSSSAIGCPADAIEVSEISVGWSRVSWQAQCRGVVFFCSGESDASCAPALSPPQPNKRDR